MRKTSSPQAKQTQSLRRTTGLPKKRALPRTHRCPACQARSSSNTCTSCGTRKATSKTSIDSRLDGLLRKWTLARANGECERCGLRITTLLAIGAHLEDAHYVPRRNRATRWHPDNRAALCVGPHEAHGGCHRVIDTFTPAHERRAFFVSRRGETAIAEVDELHRHPWDRDRAKIVALLIERGVMKSLRVTTSQEARHTDRDPAKE